MFDTVSLLDRAPEGIRRLAYRIAAGSGLLGRVADAARYRYSASDIPQLAPVNANPVRLLIGPANSAGQGYQWARAVQRHVAGATCVAMHGIGSDPFRPDADLRVPVAVYQRSAVWHEAFESYLAHQTHIMWESGLPLLGRRYGSDVIREASRLRDLGVQGALLFHGSDIRPPARHAAQSRWSPFRDSSGPARALEDTALRNADLTRSAGLPVFVSTPDMLQWVPDATWLPVVIDSQRWRAAASQRRPGRTPVVAHAPSQRWLKGTDHIEPMLRRLADEGVIEYRQVLGVPHDTMPQFYADADIVVDQMVLGIYGVAACEAMASGRIVMSHVGDFTRAAVRERTGWELPVHESTIESLEADLRRAAAEPESFEALRKAGPDFVDAVHDGRRSVAAMEPFLGTTGSER